MVCCRFGKYGCCNPFEHKEKSAAANTAYALFDEAGWDGSSNLYGFTIDTNSAEKSQIEIPSFEDYGEIPRVFTFDGSRNLFYLLRANFTDPGFNGTAQIFATTTDPVKGTSTQILVQGAAGLVTGFEYVRSIDKIVFATYTWKDGKRVGYSFYIVDPAVGKALRVSTFTFGSDGDNYVGWFEAVSADGTKLYRIGYQDVVNSVGQGLGITDISKSVASTVWHDGFSQPTGLNFYSTIDLYQDTYLSLATDTNDGTLSIVQWSLTTAPHVLAQLGDAHFPMYFGPIASALDHQQTKYCALVVHDGWDPVQTARWALAVLDLKTKKATTTSISPWMIAGVDSATGFGLSDQ